MVTVAKLREKKIGKNRKRYLNISFAKSLKIPIKITLFPKELLFQI